MKIGKLNRSGFTLIELLVVMAVVGVLSVGGFASYVGSQRNARDAKRKADLETIRQALELYKSDNGSYPGSNGWCMVISGTCGSFEDYTVRNALVPTYIGALPDDPQYKGATKNYFYIKGAASDTYTLYAQQEVNNTNSYPITGCSCTAGGATSGVNAYDYQVTNP